MSNKIMKYRRWQIEENLEKLVQALTKFFVTTDVQQQLIERVFSRHLGAAATAAANQLHISSLHHFQ